MFFVDAYIIWVDRYDRNVDQELEMIGWFHLLEDQGPPEPYKSENDNHWAVAPDGFEI